MDEKPSENSKPKITRSRARHERRKRLISARKAAEATEAPITSSGTSIEADGSNNSKSPVNHQSSEGLSKSKARRLRKRNKTREKGDNTRNVSPSSEITESIRKASIEDTRVTISKSKIDRETTPTRIDGIDSNSSAKKTEVSKLSASENELLENEKNLMITASSRIGTPLTHKIGVSSNDSRELIINKELSEISEGNISIESLTVSKTSSNDRRSLDTCDEASLIVSTKESSNELTKVCLTSQSTASSEKMISQEKTREQVKAEREAKKAAKAAAKSKSKVGKTDIVEKTVETPSSTKDSKKITKDRSKTVAPSVKIVANVTQQPQPATTETTKKPEVVPCSTDAKNDGKSKSELRAERRAKQEAQRAAKQSQATEKAKPKVTSVKVSVEPTKTMPVSPGKIDDPTKKTAKRAAVRENAHEVSLFKHLYHEREQALINVPTVNSTIHPAVVRLGVQYANKVIVGSNARCVALLAAVKQLIEDFERPSHADFTRGLEACLQESSAYLHHCRPLAVSMQNALRHLKWQMTQLPATISDEEAKIKLGNAIDTYIQEQIQLADKAISITIQTKISNGDVILTYSYSSLICKILCDAYDAGRQFRVVVVDGRPWLEGREQLRRLAKHGLECSYVLINALSFIMPEVSKVFLGAHAILANGAVMSRVGTAQVALMAKAFNVPVLVACETHKTCERVQTDSIVYNEIADADELAQNLMGSSKRTTLMNWRGKKSLNLLNLTYDVTPADLVTAVVTELAILPCTSVPVILRIKPSEI